MTPSSLPLWVQYLQALATPTIALFTVAIATIQVIIARRQWKTAHEKVVLDLFDRRMKLYQELKSSIQTYNGHRREADQRMIEIAKVSGEAQFLFGDEVVQYVVSLYDALNNLDLISKSFVKTDDGEERNKLRAERKPHYNLLQNFYTDAPKLFAPYMRMSQKLVTPSE